MTDGVVTLRAPGPGDAAVLVVGRDEEFHRWLGPGSDDPQPVACIVVAGRVVGWVDYDTERAWLEPGAVNVGYNVFAAERGRGYASRSVQLLMHHLATYTQHRTATLLIDPGNTRSLALAARLGFHRRPDLDGRPFFAKPVPPIAYTDGVVTLRPPRPDDLDADLAAKDEEQMRWMWRPGEREAWLAMTAGERREHARRGLLARCAAWGSGPKWTFSVDVAHRPYVAYVDCDLANDGAPAGEANVSYSTDPAHRGRGYTSRAVRLALGFLRDHTGAREAHIRVDAANAPSLRVARALGALEVDRDVDGERTMISHVVAVPPRIPAR